MYTVPRGIIQPVDLTKYKWWDKVVPIFTKGQYPDGREVSRQGINPYEVQYVEGPDAREFHDGPTGFATAIPTVYNADTLGIRPDLLGREVTSWAELLNPEFKGRTALVDVPQIGIMDAAMAIEARGDIKYGDKGNMTQEEIDKTIEILIEAKRSGQFRAFWTTFDESVNLMASGEVVLQSMWSPAVTAVRSRGIDCYYVPLKEGYRAWGSCIAPMAHLSGLKLDAAYEYLNWYQSGWQGGFIAKQGYYTSVPETAKQFMTQNEWDYWYEGKPAQEVIKDPYGTVMEQPGRGARRRLLLGAHGQRRLLEHADGREPVHDPALERVHRRLIRSKPSAGRLWPPRSVSPSIIGPMKIPERLIPYLQVLPLTLVLLVFLGFRWPSWSWSASSTTTCSTSFPSSPCATMSSCSDPTSPTPCI